MKKYGLYCYLGDKSLKTALPLVRLSYGTKVKALYESLTKTERSYLAKEFKASMKEKPYRSKELLFRLLFFLGNDLLGSADVFKSDIHNYISLAVRKDARRCGIGTQFVEAAIQIVDFDYTVDVKNKPSYTLANECYARHGFDEIDILPAGDTWVTFPFEPRELAAETGVPIEHWL